MTSRGWPGGAHRDSLGSRRRWDLCNLGPSATDPTVMPGWFGLRLDPEGFTVRMNLGSRRYRWVDVERFFVLIYVHLASVESCSRAAPRNQMLPGSPNKPAISAGSSTTNGSTSA